MLCPRCGAVFEGNFCPVCGTPAPRSNPPLAPPAPAYGSCPRCGAVFIGNFCPRCGLPAGAIQYGPAPSSAPRTILSVLWTLALAGFLILVALNLIGLFVGPSFVLPGIRGITSGQSTNPDFAAGGADWTFVAISPSASGTYVATGGNTDGYLEMTFPPSTSLAAMWTQRLSFTGSAPYGIRLDLDVIVQTLGTAPLGGRLVATIDPFAGSPNFANVTTVGWYNATTAGWTPASTVDLSERVSTAGTYYLKIAFLADPNAATVTVGLDNVRLAWVTDAAVFFYLPLPNLPSVFVSQDPTLFIAYYVFLVAAITLACLYYALRESRLFVATILAPVDRIGTRLRSMSAWVAITQSWLAVTFVQVAIVLLLTAIGPPPSSPISPTAGNTWVLLFELANASVYEELVFRALLIGAPMALGSLLMSVATGRRTAIGGSPLAHAARYLAGGNLRATSSKEALLAGWVLLFGSSTVFGLAHAPGWGWWKVVPAMIAGLAFGYLFLRHGIGAAIIAHFVSDYTSSLTYEGVGGITLSLFTDLLFLGLAIAGAGFLLWYVIDAWGHARDLWRRFTGHRVLQPAPAVPVPPPGTTYAPRPWTPPASPPSTAFPGTPSPLWQPIPPPPQAPPPPTAIRDSSVIPREYVPSYHPPPYGFPPVRFQCPSCGWVEAKYENRHFTCLRCGRAA